MVRCQQWKICHQPFGGAAADGGFTAGKHFVLIVFERGRCNMGRIRIGRSNGCWIDVFDAEGFSGNMRRLHGPAEFIGLRIREKDWGESIASINVGPAAYVQCFDSHDFVDTVSWLLPNQSAESL